MASNDFALGPFDETGKKSYNVETGQVIFVKEGENVDVNAQTKLIGLTKEQLEQYRNDPFWKPVRYALFVLFWLIWLGMFVAAILIVVLSPKCNSTALEFKGKWFESLINYQIYTPTFRDSDGDGVGDLKGIEEKLDTLRKIGVKSIWPTSFVKANKDEFSPAEVLDIGEVDTRYGSFDDLKSLVAKAHAKDIKFVADIPLTVSNSNEWALKTPGAILGDRSQGNSTLLNVENAQVQEKLLETVTKLLQIGVDGIYFADFGFAKRTPPKSLDPLIAKIRTAAATDASIPQKEVLIFTEPTWKTTTTSDYQVYSLLDVDNRNVVDNLVDNIQKGYKLIEESKKGGNVPKPIWKYTDLDSPRLDQRLALNPILDEKWQEASQLLTLIQLFLPGPVIVYYGEEIGLPSIKPSAPNQYPQRGVMRWSSNETNVGFSSFSGKNFFDNLSSDANVIAFDDQFSASKSPLKVFKRMAELRNKNGVLQGGALAFKRDGLHLYARYVEGSPNTEVFVLAVNWPVDGRVSAQKLKLDTAFVQSHSLTQVEVKVASLNAWSQLGRTFNLEKEELIVEPYQALVMRIA